MKLTGKLLPPIVNYSGQTILQFTPNEDIRAVYEELKKDDLSLSIKKYRKKRSLDANAYYWVLLTKLARKIGISNPELHNRMLCDYGCLEKIDGQLVTVQIPDTSEAEQKVNSSTLYHLYPTTQVKGNYRTYYLLRGSSTYNAKEMADLIKGLISECMAAEIPENEIATPDEKAWLSSHGIEI